MQPRCGAEALRALSGPLVLSNKLTRGGGTGGWLVGVWDATSTGGCGCSGSSGSSGDGGSFRKHRARWVEPMVGSLEVAAGACLG